MIEIKSVNKYYGNHHVLQNVHASFEPGHVYGIVGENGAGKTTLFRCIAGLEKFEGIITSEYSPLKNHLGFLITDPFLFPKITGIEYIRLLCNARKIDPGNIDEKNVFDLPLRQYASTYSTGMKKKLALLAILLQNNEYFILDEPFNGVDIQSNMVIVEIIHRLKALNKCIIIASHIFSTLTDTCDEIHLLQNGKITRKVVQSDFLSFEQEMKKSSVADKVAALNLK